MPIKLSDAPNSPISNDPTQDRVWRDWFRDLLKVLGSSSLASILPFGYLKGDGVTSTVHAVTSIPLTDTTGNLPANRIQGDRVLTWLDM